MFVVTDKFDAGQICITTAAAADGVVKALLQNVWVPSHVLFGRKDGPVVVFKGDNQAGDDSWFLALVDNRQ